jgi:hypothetical protein
MSYDCLKTQVKTTARLNKGNNKITEKESK